MKTTFFIAFFFISAIGITQNNYIVKTDDGRRVLLKADFTWEYIDMQSPVTDSLVKQISKPKISKRCDLAEDFQEPKLNTKIQSQLKKSRSTIDHVKKKVAKDYKCEVEDIILISYKEQKEKGMYDFCAKGTLVTYKRIGGTIIKNGQLL